MITETEWIDVADEIRRDSFFHRIRNVPTSILSEEIHERLKVVMLFRDPIAR